VPVERAGIVDRQYVKLELKRRAFEDAVLHGSFGADPACSLRRSKDIIPCLGFYQYKITRN
jgi:hypothetical protein